MQTTIASAPGAFDAADEAGSHAPLGFALGNSHQNLRQLVAMRNVAIAAQAITVLAVARFMAVQLPVAALLQVIAALALVNLLTWYRLRWQRPVSERELVAQLLVDIAALTALLALSGGATNPFIGMFVLPLTIAAACLPTRYTWIVALVTVACYSALAFFHLPLVGVGEESRFQQLIVTGLWVNYAITAGMIAFFVARLAGSTRRHQQLAAEQRERDLQSEHLMRIGTLAAGAAHELAQPLATMAVAIGELQHRARGEADLEPMTDRLAQQLRSCQETLGALLSYGRQTIATDIEIEGFDTLVQRSLTAFHARRPEVVTRLTIDTPGPAPRARHDVALRQAIVNLLSNAADASSEPIDVTLGWDATTLYLAVRDRGPGLAPETQRQVGRLFFTTKPQGSGNGLGLFLAQTAIARLGGALQLANAEGGGAVARIVLPVASLGADAVNGAAR
jgi:two-component system sensor histidine kinase RegB